MRETTKRKQNALYQTLQGDPIFHIEEVQGIKTLEGYQRGICRDVVENDRVNIAACHDVGKTFIMGKIVAWFMSSFPGGICITTAPTYRQVEKLLWGEIRKACKNSVYQLGGKIFDGKAEWKFDDDWYAIGFSPKKESGGNSGDGEQVGSSAQGFHGKYMLIVIDEGPGVPKQVWDMIEGMTTSANVKVVSIGNPTTKNCQFFTAFNSPFAKARRITCFDSPNLIANGVTNLKALEAELAYVKTLGPVEILQRLQSYEIVQPYLLTLKWVVESAINWGIEHPLFQSKALAQFPKQDSHAMFDLQSIIDAQARTRSKADPEGIYIGVDPARFGTDKTIITGMHDWAVDSRLALTKMDTTFVADEVANILRAQPLANRQVCCVDTIGIGAGVYDRLVELQERGIISKSWELTEINFAAKPYFDEPGYEEPKASQRKSKQLFLNLKARIFRLLSGDLKEHIILKDLQIYQEQLPTILYEFKQGKMKIESKDEYKSRTGLSSPDDADSLAIANFGRYVPSNRANIWVEKI